MKKLNLQNEIKEPYLLKEERQSAIMKYAMEHASFSSKEVAHRLKVSSKTIVNDMKQINTAFHGAAKFRGGHGTFELCIYNYDQFQAVSQKCADTTIMTQVRKGPYPSSIFCGKVKSPY